MKENLVLIAKYNIWNNQTIECGFTRKLYLDKIMATTGSRLIKVLTGQRRTGKSFILRQTMMALISKGVKPENTLFISKEFIDYDFLNDYKDLNYLFKTYYEEFKPEGRIFLFIDEIQNINEWERFVNSISQNYTFDCELFITGSNSRMLSSELATLLSGRYIKIPVYTFSYDEHISRNHETKNRDSYMKYIHHGGLPELANFTSEEGQRYYVSSIKDTIMLRDIVERYTIRDVRLLDDLFAYLVGNASNPISIQKLVKYFKSKQRNVSYETIANYIRYICNTYLIHPISQYNIKGKQVTDSIYKYYINDLSYKNYLYQGIGYGIGYLLENEIYLELKRHGYNVYEGSIQGREVDFVATKNDRKIYIQVAYSIEDDVTRHREYESLLSISDSYEKWLVTLDELNFPIHEGIKHIQAWNFTSNIHNI